MFHWRISPRVLVRETKDQPQEITRKGYEWGNDREGSQKTSKFKEQAEQWEKL